ncbi:hypothetical protein AURANDRAFT_72082 [Aureococcus anophagefferens]|uniref:TRP C-terminal domain-containing protein n=1 Tax=Aureococcus anophagefferens TaxID=44056 RepID=F0YFV4_AURAN|nr:hypothetical protein AURANDRAFT_72082 [Aureococcus anophagefferens]EGB05994.1 hypothetical protein AURANDRAFT_72082 [Aureococcus anophagefferens]|eukprot:XP_009039253.1 hypothetical protein AURANDRAFT_72082 [Aureococcus anophagefferens]
MQCERCPASTYQPQSGQLGCDRCSSFQLGRTSRQGSTTCDFCEEGLYLADDDTAVDGSRCVSCPDHATCAEGTTIETIAVHDGCWRTTPGSSKVRKCFREDACVGGAGNASRCADGYYKTLCAACERDFYRDMSTGQCHACDAAAARRFRHFFGFHVLLLVLFLTSPFLVMHAVRKAVRRAASRQLPAASSPKSPSKVSKIAPLYTDLDDVAAAEPDPEPEPAPGEYDSDDHTTMTLPPDGAVTDAFEHEAPGGGAFCEHATMTLPPDGAVTGAFEHEAPGGGAFHEHATMTAPPDGAVAGAFEHEAPGEYDSDDHTTMTLPPDGAVTGAFEHEAPGGGAFCEHATMTAPPDGAVTGAFEHEAPGEYDSDDHTTMTLPPDGAVTGAFEHEAPGGGAFYDDDGDGAAAEAPLPGTERATTPRDVHAPQAEPTLAELNRRVGPYDSEEEPPPVGPPKTPRARPAVACVRSVPESVGDEAIVEAASVATGSTFQQIRRTKRDAFVYLVVAGDDLADAFRIGDATYAVTWSLEGEASSAADRADRILEPVRESLEASIADALEKSWGMDRFFERFVAALELKLADVPDLADLRLVFEILDGMPTLASLRLDLVLDAVRSAFPSLEPPQLDGLLEVLREVLPNLPEIVDLDALLAAVRAAFPSLKPPRLLDLLTILDVKYPSFERFDSDAIVSAIEEAIMAKVKILVVFLQTMSYLPDIYYHVYWPDQLTRVLSLFNPLNLDLFSLIHLECMVKKLSFYDRLLAVTIGPVLASAALGTVAVVSKTRSAKCIDLFLKLCFFVFSSTSTSIFQAFACDDSFDDGRSLLACDYSISCKTSKFRAFSAYAIMCVFVYPIGIVALFTTLVVARRRAIDPPLGDDGARRVRLEETETVERCGRASLAEQSKNAQRRAGDDSTLKSIGFLWMHYLPMFWWFEITESVRRLLVTAVAVTVQPGSSTQLAYGLLTAVLSLALYSIARPFSNHLDNALAIVASMVLVLATFSGLLISAEVTKDESWSVVGVGAVLAGLTVAVVVLSVALVLLQAKALLQKLVATKERYCAPS